MKVSINGFKKLALVAAGSLVAATVLVVSAPARATGDDDTAALYKSKCAMCHGQTADRKIDKTKTDDVLIPIVLDGKTMEKPPNMPAFKDRGINADQAKALVAYLKSLK